MKVAETETISTVPLGKLLAYLNPVSPEQPELNGNGQVAISGFRRNDDGSPIPSGGGGLC